ncbi:PAS domain-containing sensor histidine kinase [Flavobacterium sp. HXWNR29]|uniref:sensor histidine kinase n=1 Tax=Flavobacterium odoriferum TaxID=2946604 RepID=UPI0021CB2781|nr:PAS domain-containing sensor histidine kinase [Flavobacterium sp. HXWNR29]MCU4188601.1 PAS domain-containing sensor histidine kinase [Flavobacterium sp. HXWNR29]
MIFTSKKPEDLNKLYESLIKQLPNIIFQIRVTANREVHLEFISKPVEFLYQFSIEEILEDSYKFAKYRIYESDLKVFKETFNVAVETKAKWEVDFRFLLPDSSYKWIRIEATPKATENDDTIFYGLLSDITTIKEQEIQLRVADERYHFAVQASDRGVWDWDMVTNKVYYSSESMKILGLTESDLVASPEEWDDRVHPDDREEYYGNINLHFENKIPFYETCHRVLCNGEYKWILDRGKVIERDENGKPLRIAGTHTDISAQKEKEQELLKMLEIVNLQNNKLLNFAHIVSHNLRTHAGNIKSLLELYHNSSFTHEETITNIDIVSKELNETIENLNDLVKVHTQTNKEFVSSQLSDYITRMLYILNEDITNKNIIIENNVNEKIQVNCIPAYLESILLNLVTNAIKYSNDKKDILISFNVTDTTDFLILNVSDNGVGIDMERYGSSIFGLYKTFHGHEDSRGVGLYITKNQIETMGGKIEVESKPNVGSTFKVYFKK